MHKFVLIPRTEEFATAYHEAGHAVAAVVLELPFEVVTIVPNDKTETLGHVSIVGSLSVINLDRREFRAENRDDLIMTMAGPVAEERLRGKRND